MRFKELSQNMTASMISPVTSPKTAFLSNSNMQLQNSDEFIKVTHIADYGAPKIINLEKDQND